MKKFSLETKEAFLKAITDGVVAKALEDIKAAADAGSFKMIVSSEHQDRQQETVMQDGINIANYIKNPVVLNTHDYWSVDNIVALTTSLSLQIVDGVKSLVAQGKFAPTDNGQIARKLYDGGFLNAASIGFIPLTFDAANESIIATCEMLEWSFCSVPANANALRLAGVDAAALRTKGFALKEEPAPEPEIKSPECRQDGETKQECVSRKIPEIKKDNPDMAEDQVIAIAESMCSKSCSTKAEGDICTMEDGSEGMMKPDENGNMVCMPNAEKNACPGGINIPEKTEPLPDVIASLYKKAIGEMKDIQQVGAILAFTQNLIDEALVVSAREILAIFQSEYGQSVQGRAELEAAVKSSEPLKAIKASIADVEKKLGISAGEEPGNGGPPNQRPEGGEGVVPIKDLNDFLMVRELLASVNRATNEALSRTNRKIASERETRWLK